MKQKFESVDWRVAAHQTFDGDVLDVTGQLNGRSMEWSCNRVDRLTGAACGGTT
jgi:hypothetical protein